ncbi:cofilin-1-A-like [Denticeps clupeoides]|uniref:ADF-H domain-containing protein n=1 Tax=Denticeps clupeoides TaxID=299321 RepID=A0A8C4D3A5_9TELE|nr:cofilin-1-A-like [Denticeps clupeoides]
MASGVAIDDDVVTTYDKIRVRHQGSVESERLKLVVFCISSDGKSIIVDTDSNLIVKDVESSDDVFKKIIGTFPKTECRYALYDCTYATKESTKEDLVFIMWVPEEAPLKSKMMYASSKGALKAKLPGLKFEWQVNDLSDAKDPSVLIDKLGGRGTVKSLEGKAL